MTTPLCSCGTFAVGLCIACKKYYCGTHSKIFSVNVCDKHIDHSCTTSREVDLGRLCVDHIKEQEDYGKEQTYNWVVSMITALLALMQIDKIEEFKISPHQKLFLPFTGQESGSSSKTGTFVRASGRIVEVSWGAGANEWKDPPISKFYGEDINQIDPEKLIEIKWEISQLIKEKLNELMDYKLLNPDWCEL